MKIQHTLTALCTALTLSACGGGGGGSGTADLSAAVVPELKLSAANMLNATAVAMVADQRVSGYFAELLGLVFPHYVNQVADGTYPCAKSGSVTLSRSGASRSLWTFTVKQCASLALNIASGALEIDTAGADTTGLGFNIRDITYAQSDMITVVSTVNGKYNFLVPSKDDVRRSSTGAMTLVRLGITHIYTDHYAESKQSDNTYLKQGVKAQSPRFPHALSVVYDKGARSYTLSADDGSTVVATLAANGDTVLELRRTATGAVLASQVVLAADMSTARTKAL